MARPLPVLSVIGSISVWSLWPVVVRKVPLDPLFLVVYVSFLGSLSLVPLFAFKKPPYRRGFGRFFVLGAFFLFLNSFFYFKSVEMCPVSLAVITHYTAPIFVAVFSPMFLNEPRKSHVFLSIFLSTLGLAIALDGLEVSGRWVFGAFLGVLSGLFYGLGVIVAKHILGFFSEYGYMLYASLVSLILYSVPFFLKPPPVSLVPSLFVVSVFMSSLPAFFYLWGLRRLGAQEVALMSYLEPILATFWGFVFFGEKLTLRLGIGGFLVLLGSYVAVREG